MVFRAIPHVPLIHSHSSLNINLDLHSINEVEEFLDESLLMMEFSHSNILGLTGVCFDTPDGVPYIILPFMDNGSLKDFLKKKRTHVTNVDILPEVII